MRLVYFETLTEERAGTVISGCVPMMSCRNRRFGRGVGYWGGTQPK